MGVQVRVDVKLELGMVGWRINYAQAREGCPRITGVYADRLAVSSAFDKGIHSLYTMNQRILMMTGST